MYSTHGPHFVSSQTCMCEWVYVGIYVYICEYVRWLCVYVWVYGSIWEWACVFMDKHMCICVNIRVCEYLKVCLCIGMCITEYVCEGMCMFLPLDWEHVEGRDSVLAHPYISCIYSINVCCIMNENERTLYLVKANYTSVPFPFFISNLSCKFTTKFFKCYCVGYMEVVHFFGVQVLCGINNICLSL